MRLGWEAALDGTGPRTRAVGGTSVAPDNVKPAAEVVAFPLEQHGANRLVVLRELERIYQRAHGRVGERVAPARVIQSQHQHAAGVLNRYPVHLGVGA